MIFMAAHKGAPRYLEVSHDAEREENAVSPIQEPFHTISCPANESCLRRESDQADLESGV